MNVSIFRMTLDVGPEDELPDWAAAKEFYQKYDPKDIIGRSELCGPPLCPSSYW